eukprot:521315-Pyramimonas_sp.AAC.1
MRHAPPPPPREKPGTPFTNATRRRQHKALFSSASPPLSILATRALARETHSTFDSPTQARHASYSARGLAPRSLSARGPASLAARAASRAGE